MKKILIVDDEPSVLNVITEYVQDVTEYKIIQAENGETAMEIIKKEKPDLILSDMFMPRVSGIALLKNVKNNMFTKHIPVILMTGVLKDEYFANEGIEMGAVDYILKPIDLKDLVEKINSYLKN